MSESDQSRNRIFQELEAAKVDIGWNEATGTTRKFWEQFEREHQHRLELVLLLAQELSARKLSISDFYLAQFRD